MVVSLLVAKIKGVMQRGLVPNTLAHFYFEGHALAEPPFWCIGQLSYEDNNGATCSLFGSRDTGYRYEFLGKKCPNQFRKYDALSHITITHSLRWNRISSA